MAYFRRVVPPIKQSAAWTCWAAALSWWTQVVPGRTVQSQQGLIDAYATDSDSGSLDAVTGWPPLANDLGLAYQVVAGSDLDPGQLESQLRDKGYIVLAYRRGANDSHAVVIYGVSDQNINVMDPELGQFRWFTAGWLNAVPAVIVAWPSW